MARFLLIPLAICLSTGIAHALPGVQTPESPSAQCTAAIAAAERGHAIPPQLMAAIGRVESGRRDPDTGATGAWPWTINAEGTGSYFDSKADAIKAVQALQARGVHSIDVGCMQINLLQHPAAFPNLDLAFEPAVNADYAARFLVQLHGQTGDWVKATASYHSGNPWEGDPYAVKVTSVWPEEQRKAGANPSPPLEPGRVGPVAGAIAPFPNHQPPRMLTMASLTPGMATSRGMATSGGIAASGVMAPAMMEAGTTPSGTLPGQIAHPAVPSVASARQIARPAMMRAATAQSGTSGQPTSNPGRGLDSYRAAPIRMVMLSQLPARMPFGAMMR
ncbi:MAG: transglycosylase SLT domain-containing protein [Acetobacteraceae bacterium]